MDAISTDILVAGGGLAGCLAAIAARRVNEDASVVLVERYGFLGGMATAGYVFPFMRYHAELPGGKKRLVGGLFKELTDRLLELGYAETHPGEGDLVARFDPAMLRCTLDAMVVAAGVKIIFHAIINQVDTAPASDGQRRVVAVTAQHKAGPIRIVPACIVDATGDADITFHAGGHLSVGRTSDGLVQPATLNFRMGNIEPDHAVPAAAGFYRSEIMEAMHEEKARGNPLTPRDDCLMFAAGKGQFHFNQTRVAGFDFTDPFQRSAAEIEGRAQAERYIRFLKERVDGYQDAVVAGLGTELGVRETRRIVGDHVLEEDAIVACKHHDDRIALGNYGIDIHDPDGSAATTIKHVPKGQWYSIPHACLLPRGLANVIVAGRPISTTHEAHSATRIMPTCAAIGHAAGVSAAMFLNQETPGSFRSVDVKAVQDVLRAHGAILD